MNHIAMMTKYIHLLILLTLIFSSANIVNTSEISAFTRIRDYFIKESVIYEFIDFTISNHSNTALLKSQRQSTFPDQLIKCTHIHFPTFNITNHYYNLEINPGCKKFSAITVAFISILDGTKDLLTDLKNIKYRVFIQYYATNLNPEHLIFYFGESPENNRLYFRQLISNRRWTVTSTFWLIGEPSSENVSLVCTSCSHFDLILSMEGQTRRSFDMELIKKLNRNFHHCQVWADGEITSKYLAQRYCHSFQTLLHASVHYKLESLCLYYELESKHNFTTTISGYHYLGSFLKLAVHTSTANNLWMFDPKPGVRNTPSSHAGFVNSYKFGLIVKDPVAQMDPYTMLTPFDIWTWSGHIVTFIVMTLCFYKVCGSCDPNEKNGRFGKTIFWMVSILLIKIDDHLGGKLFRKPFWLTSCLTTILATVYFLLGNLYEGAIFSSLTTQELPTFPRTMQELVKSKFGIAFAGERVDYWNSMNFLYANYITNETRANYVLLRNRMFVTFLPNDAYFAYFIATPVNKTRGHYKPLDPDGTFAIFGAHHAVTSLSKCLELLLNGTVAVSLDEIEVHVKKHTLFYGSRNSADVLVKTLSQLEESGIYPRWRTIVEKYAILHEFGKVHNYDLFKAHGLKKYQNINAAYVFTPQAVEDRISAKLFPEAVQVSLKTVIIPVVVCMISLSFPSLYFLLMWLKFGFVKFWVCIKNNKCKNMKKMNKVTSLQVCSVSIEDT